MPSAEGAEELQVLEAIFADALKPVDVGKDKYKIVIKFQDTCGIFVCFLLFRS